MPHRTNLAVLAPVLLLAIAGVGVAAATTSVQPTTTVPVADRAAHPDHDVGPEDANATPQAEHHADPAATPTAAEQAAADRLVADTLAGTARFADFAAAEAEGFVRVTPYPLAGAGPAHFLSPAAVFDGRYLDPEHPEALVYFRTRDGGMHLLGALYLAPPGDGPTPGGPVTQWHGHPDGCIARLGDTPDIAIADETGACPAGFIPIEHEMMHVWTFGHPDGPFTHEFGFDGLRAAVALARSADAD